MRTDIYTLDDIRIKLINMLCLQYVEILLKDGRISKKYAEILTKRYEVTAQENRNKSVHIGNSNTDRKVVLCTVINTKRKD